MKVVVVIPTYNERKNIESLIPQALKSLEKVRHDCHILVVDDSSPDGTADEVKRLQSQHANVHLSLGKKLGFGRAYARGFAYATGTLKADVIITMDADFSHHPKYLPSLIKKIEEGYDVVIGSRYVEGGATPDWPTSRKITSWGANALAKYGAGLHAVNDCTGGFRAISTKRLLQIPPAKFAVRGYVFQITLLYYLLRQGAKVTEIPIVFRDRTHGQTKLQTKDKLEYIYNILLLRFQSHRRLIKFLIVGGSGVIVNIGLLMYMVERLAFNKHLASPLAIEVSIIYNFLFNNFWTFKHSKNTSRKRIKFLKFQAIATAGLAINYAIFALLESGLGIWYPIAQFVGILFAFLWNYYVNLNWTWRESEK